MPHDTPPPAPDGGTDDAGAVADDQVRDALPADLDASGFVGVYRFPDNKRRRIPGAIYVLSGLGAIAAWILAGDGTTLVNAGVGWAGLGLVMVGLYVIVAGWPLEHDEKEALERATAAVEFPVGHASAQLGWRGMLSRPTWRILLYSAEEPPQHRGLFLVDGHTGEVLEHFVEDNPEDWAELAGPGSGPQHS